MPIDAACSMSGPRAPNTQSLSGGFHLGTDEVAGFLIVARAAFDADAHARSTACHVGGKPDVKRLG